MGEDIADSVRHFLIQPREQNLHNLADLIQSNAHWMSLLTVATSGRDVIDADAMLFQRVGKHEAFSPFCSPQHPSTSQPEGYEDTL